MNSDDLNQCLEEWKTLRQETLQSQNQRLTVFQVSLALFAAVYGAFLTPLTGLRNEPLVFQAFLSILLIPFVRLVGALRLRDYYQACYIGHFTRLQLPNIRYTTRNNQFDEKLRQRTSSGEGIRVTYIVLGLATLLLTLGISLLAPTDSTASFVQRLGAASVWPSLFIRLLLLLGAFGLFMHAIQSAKLSDRWQQQLFEEFRRIVVRELLTGHLRPYGFAGRALTDPTTWNELFGGESKANREITLAAIRASVTEYPDLSCTVRQLAKLWGIKMAGDPPIPAVTPPGPPAVTPPGPGAKTNSGFEEFLIAEYNNIAQAHFTTINSISEFFRNYIVIVSLPVSVAVIFLKPAELKASGILEFLMKYPLIPPLLLTSVALVGLSVLGYVINLRFDALLYARTVNGIRKYFSESSGLAFDEEIRFRALPKSTYFPKYIESSYFVFVVLTFALVGTGYCLAGWYFYWWANRWGVGLNFWLLVGLCPWAHLLMYGFLGRHREREYLRGHIIGVDIDGVLNNHRRHFAEVLKSQTGKQIDPESITRIPVHEIPGGSVTEDDEHAVFNWPTYWTEMSPLDGAARSVRRLRNLFRYRIWIFTHRPWPQPATYPAGHEEKYWNAWRELSWWAIPSRWRFVRTVEGRLRECGIAGLIEGKLIWGITKRWLSQHRFEYNRLIVERGNTETTDPLILTRNRFLTSRENKIRVFVEDDLSKARKLADICELVFLVDHPYNKTDAGKLPINIIRVTSWQEIYEFLRRVF